MSEKKLKCSADKKWMGVCGGLAEYFGVDVTILRILCAILIKTPYELLEAIPKAFEIATSGRPGPVLIDVPRDVQLKECDFDTWPDIKKIRLHDIRFHTPIDEYSEKMGKLQIS